MQRPLRDVLEEGLVSHQYVLQLDPANDDALFNTSQVLTAIAEMMATNEEEPGDAEAMKMLREALELQGRCLGIQEQKYEEFLAQERAADEQGGAENTNPPDAAYTRDATEDADEEWFNVIEPVTRDTLIDTVLAQLGTLTTFCSILSSSFKLAPKGTLAWVEGISTTLIRKAESFSCDQQNRLREIALARANLLSAMLEAGYKSSQIDVETYKRERDAAFASTELQLERSVDGLIHNARSLLAFNSALTDTNNGDVQSHSVLRWNALTASIANLRSASAMQGISEDDLSTTHLLRGEASLYLYGMAFPPASYPTATSSAMQNAKNAEVYYRNASKLSQDQEEKDISSIRSAVAQYLQAYYQGQGAGCVSGLFQTCARGQAWVATQLEEMMAENLVPQGAFVDL